MIHPMSLATSKRTAPRRCRDDAKALFRNAILESAERVFAERGFHGARIQDIAEQARIAVGTVYNHFEQKEDVLRALLEERTDALLEALAASPADPEDFEAKLGARLGRMLRYLDRHREFYLIANEHGLLSKTTASSAKVLGKKSVRHVERFRAAFGALVDDGVEAGVVDPLERSRLIWFLGGLVRSFALGSLESGETSAEAEVPLIVRFFLSGAGRAGRKPARKPR